MIPWRRPWQPTSVFLPGESPWTRSLVGYNPLGHKESDMTEKLSTTQCRDALFLTNEARIFSGAKTASSIKGAGKTGQLHVEE